MLAEYHFTIKYIKETKNTKANALYKILKLQSNKKILGAVLQIDSDGKF